MIYGMKIEMPALVVLVVGCQADVDAVAVVTATLRSLLGFAWLHYCNASKTLAIKL
jgi:hypothetical protein